MRVVITIPIYSPTPSQNEIASLRQCYKVLSRYNIVIFAPLGLDLHVYNDAIGKELNVEYFGKEFFCSVHAYSELMKQHNFYKRFSDYDYMLVYQLDAWVFEDKLTEWYEKGYDYIGAPVFANFGGYEDGNRYIGLQNGGLSLRKISKFLKITNSKTRVANFNELWRETDKSIIGLAKCIIKVVGYRNNISFYTKEFEKENEDFYFCKTLGKYVNVKLKLPDFEESACFAFEESARYLYDNVVKKLPFGCHAWEKHDNDFWVEKGLPAK